MNMEHIEPSTTINTDGPIELKSQMEVVTFKSTPKEVKEILDNDNMEVVTFKPAPKEVKEILDNIEADNLDGGIFGEVIVHPNNMKSKLLNSLTTENGLTYSLRNGHNTSSHSVTKDNLNVYNKSKKFNDGSGGDGGMSDLERRVHNLESETQKMRQQLEEIKIQNITLSHQLEGVATKSQLNDMKNDITNSILAAIKPLPSTVEVKNIIHEVNKEDEIATKSDVNLIVLEGLKDVPKANDIRAVVDTAITDKKLTSETSVENMMMKTQKSMGKWMITTAIAVGGLLFTALKLFL
ncbi:hypothetical protein SFC65_04485 [Priestia filamentosa]|uniref:hypothetical protein n=1 Tax=Priestia filamentosa TaxID=1402861 RepID=UPI003981E071